MLHKITRLHPFWFGVSKAEGKGVVTEKEKESVGNVKLDIEVSRGLNLFYISNCYDALLLLSLTTPNYPACPTKISL